MKTVYSL